VSAFDLEMEVVEWWSGGVRALGDADLYFGVHSRPNMFDAFITACEQNNVSRPFLIGASKS
jgi:hypothetical protein